MAGMDDILNEEISNLEEEAAILLAENERLSGELERINAKLAERQESSSNNHVLHRKRAVMGESQPKVPHKNVTYDVTKDIYYIDEELVIPVDKLVQAHVNALAFIRQVFRDTSPYGSSTHSTKKFEDFCQKEGMFSHLEKWIESSKQYIPNEMSYRERYEFK